MQPIVPHCQQCARTKMCRAARWLASAAVPHGGLRGCPSVFVNRCDDSAAALTALQARDDVLVVLDDDEAVLERIEARGEQVLILDHVRRVSVLKHPFVLRHNLRVSDSTVSCVVPFTLQWPQLRMANGLQLRQLSTAPKFAQCCRRSSGG